MRALYYVMRIPVSVAIGIVLLPVLACTYLYEKARYWYDQRKIVNILRDNMFVKVKIVDKQVVTAKYEDGRRLMVILTDHGVGFFPMYVFSEHWQPGTNTIVVNSDTIMNLETTVHDIVYKGKPLIMVLDPQINITHLANMMVATCDEYYGLIGHKFEVLGNDPR